MIQPKPLYYIIHDWMITDMHLKGGAERDVYALLYSLAGSNGVAKVGIGYIVERLGYTDRSIKNAIASLMSGGWLMKSRDAHHGVNEYGIIEPASIIGRFDKSKITGEKSSPEMAITSEKSSCEQVKKVPLSSEKISPVTPYILFDNNYYNIFFITDDESSKKEKFILLQDFFITFGIYQPMDEVIRFWNYHEQTGWRNAKGQKIASKKAAAQFWKFGNDTRKQSEAARKILTKLIQVLNDNERLLLISELINISAIKENDRNTILFEFETSKPISMIEDTQSIFQAFSRIIFSAFGKNANVEYRIKKQ